MEFSKRVVAIADPSGRQASSESPLSPAQVVNEYAELAGTSNVITQLRDRVVKLAGRATPTLIIGEPGTGKTMIAHYLHRFQGGQFAEVDCACPVRAHSHTDPNRFIQQLAHRLTDEKNQLEHGEGGTLLLRHIDDMPVALQKVIGELSERRFWESQTQNRNIRIVCTSQNALTPLVQADLFHGDLYHKLTVFPVVTPALRDRTSDIPCVIQAYCDHLYSTDQLTVRFDSDSMFAMTRYPWPENIRELFKLVKRKAIQYPNSTINVRQVIEDLISTGENDVVAEAYEASDHAGEYKSTVSGLEPIAQLPREGLDLREHLINIEKDLIRLALIETRYVLARAAKRLRLKPGTLGEKIRRYDLV